MRRSCGPLFTSLFAYRAGPCSLGRPLLVHRTVPALMINLSRSAVPHTPGVHRVHPSVSSPAASAFSYVGQDRPNPNSRNTASRGRAISALQTFLYVAALQFACPSDCSHPSMERQGLLHPGLHRLRYLPCAEYATRPNRTIVGADLSSARLTMLLAATHIRLFSYPHFAADKV